MSMKLVMVQAGWKPELSEVAADAKQKIKNLWQKAMPQ